MFFANTSIFLHGLPLQSLRPVCLAYQPPASSTFLSQQTSDQPTVLFSQNKSALAISHQPNEQAARLIENHLLVVFCSVIFFKNLFSVIQQLK
jgi:hypothetical protein